MTDKPRSETSWTVDQWERFYKAMPADQFNAAAAAILEQAERDEADVSEWWGFHRVMCRREDDDIPF